MGKEKDRRVRRTLTNLRASMTKLIQEKPLNEITVKEVAERADINRATFYLHYKDVYDMLARIENEMFEEFNEVVYAHPASELTDDKMVILTDIFSFIKKNEDMCRALLSENGDISFLNKLKSVIRDKCYDDWEELYMREKSEDYEAYYMFIISGSIGLIQYWLKSGLEESPEKMASLAHDMIMRGISVLGEVN